MPSLRSCAMMPGPPTISTLTNAGCAAVPQPKFNRDRSPFVTGTLVENLTVWSFDRWFPADPSHHLSVTMAAGLLQLQQMLRAFKANGHHFEAVMIGPDVAQDRRIDHLHS